MSKVSHFQRYSQSENHATNNTLLLLHYVTKGDPQRLRRVLTSLTDVDLSVGVKFEQQVRGLGSVLDAMISQDAFEVAVEAKIGDALWHDQIRRHLVHMSERPTSGVRVLVGLTRSTMDASAFATYSAMASSHGVTFAWVSYEQVVEAVRAEILPHETDLAEILDDYMEFLVDTGLLVAPDHRIAVFPCGVSLANNVRFALYHEPPSRRLKATTLMGFYKNRAVQHLARIEAVGVFEWADDRARLVKKERGDITDAHVARVTQVMLDTQTYDLKAEPTRVYLAAETFPTRIEKATPGGIMGLRYLDPRKLKPGLATEGMTVQSLAVALSETTFD